MIWNILHLEWNHIWGLLQSVHLCLAFALQRAPQSTIAFEGTCRTETRWTLLNYKLATFSTLALNLPSQLNKLTETLYNVVSIFKKILSIMSPCFRKSLREIKGGKNPKLRNKLFHSSLCFFWWPSVSADGQLKTSGKVFQVLAFLKHHLSWFTANNSVNAHRSFTLRPSMSLFNIETSH